MVFDEDQCEIVIPRPGERRAMIFQSLQHNVGNSPHGQHLQGKAHEVDT